jgi:ABC-type multidrug transport system ATPase subunit
MERCSLIEVVRLSVVRRRLPILQDVNLTIDEGDVIALMGPNGAGKSTLLNCLAGILRPTDGEIHRSAKLGKGTNFRRRTGFSSHEIGLYTELTALENLAFAARMHGLAHAGERARQLLDAAGLASISARAPCQLSQGLRRRLAILRAVVHDPELILLDEPFDSLDTNGTRWLEHQFARWRKANRTVCFASHNVEQCHTLADRIIWLDAGRLAAVAQTTDRFTLSRRIA